MANAITLVRTLLAFLVVAMLHVRTQQVYLLAVGLTLLLIWMDALDGWVARKLGECSKFGAVADILGDRVVEMTYWIVFVAFGWLPAWVAIVIAARGIVVDGLRALALERGMTAFGATSMMRTRLGALLVSSRLSRGAYGVGKALSFSLMILLFTPGVRAYLGGVGASLVYFVAYVTVLFCVVRGVPVLVEAKRLIA
jgi:CDP-diacylglycerol--glycerol-3-phosphate 3-phosphatidyltransferase